MTSKKRPPGRPKGLRISVQAPERLLAVLDRLKLPDTILTYRDAAEYLTKLKGLPVTTGTIYRFANGVEPQRNDLRRVFGLPALKTIHTTPCANCGEVHIRKSCPAARKPKKPRTGLTPRQKRWLAILGILYGGDGKVIK